MRLISSSLRSSTAAEGILGITTRRVSLNSLVTLLFRKDFASILLDLSGKDDTMDPLLLFSVVCEAPEQEGKAVLDGADIGKLRGALVVDAANGDAYCGGYGAGMGVGLACSYLSDSSRA